MADETLKIRVDVETATLRQFGDALKEVKKEMQDASATALPGLRAEATALSGKINELSGRHTGLTQTIRESRTEARMFRFALTELIAGFDGMANSLAFFTGASEHSTAGLHAWTGAAKDGLGAGLGMKFALDAMGVSMAGPIGIGVGVITLLGSGLGKTAEEAAKSAVNISKLEETIHNLRKELGEVTREQDAAFLEKQLADALAKRTEFLNTRHVDWLQSAVKFRAVMSDETEKVRTLDADVDAKRAAISKHYQELTKEDAKVANEATKQKLESAKLELSLMKEREEAINKLTEILNPAQAKSDKMMMEFARGYAAALETGNMKLVERAAHLGLLAKIQADNQKMLGSAKGVNTGAAPKTTAELSAEDMAGLDVLQGGIMSLTNSVQNGLANAFGEAHSLFQVFVQGVLQGIASIATRLASAAIISGIFAMFGGGFGALFGKLTGFATGGTLYEPVVGMGASGRVYSFAENSPERFAPLTSSASHSMQPQRIIVEGRIRGRDLDFIQKETTIIMRKKGGNR